MGSIALCSREKIPFDDGSVLEFFPCHESDIFYGKTSSIMLVGKGEKKDSR